MTSKSPRQECYVYITLPGKVTATTAGKFVLEQSPSGQPLGRFIYGKSYLKNPEAVPFDPVFLKLSDQTYTTVQLNGVFGALRDAVPDHWGRLVIEKHAGKTQLGEMDYLLQSPDDRAGALGFGLNSVPPAPLRKYNQTLDLAKLQTLADALIENKIPADPEAPQVQELLLLGTSMGGARPKAVVQDKAGLWIAKFNQPDDRWNYARVEHAMLRLARQCGINASESRVDTVAGKDILLVKRFDRHQLTDGYARARLVSALTILNSDEVRDARTKWSYLLLVEELRRIVAEPEKDARELFRRVCFNALISNIDDHPRNHAVIARDADWSLSPAYDLTPSPVVSPDRRDLAMVCGDQGRFANAKNILSQHARFLMQKDDAEKTIADIQKQVEHWYDSVRASGVSVKDAETIKGAFNYPGFSY
jgi:serine/threonine-protein kinase HipA